MSICVRVRACAAKRKLSNYDRVGLDGEVE